MAKTYIVNEFDGECMDLQDWLDSLDLDCGIIVEDDQAFEKLVKGLEDGTVTDQEVWEGSDDVLDKLNIKYSWM